MRSQRSGANPGIALVATAAGALVALAAGGSLGLALGVLVVVGGWALARVRSVSDLPIAIVALYVLLTFVFRPLYSLANPQDLDDSFVLSLSQLREGYERGAWLVLLGFVCLLGGWVLGDRREARASECHDRPDASGVQSADRVAHIASLPLMVLLAASVIGGYLVLEPAGGLLKAVADVKVVRAELEGQRLPLIAVWTAQAASLLVMIRWNSATRLQRHVAVAALIWGTLVNLATGSRGNALPFLVAAALIYLYRPIEGSRHLERPFRRLLVVATPLVVLMLVFGAYKQFTRPGAPATFDAIASNLSSVTYGQVAAQFKDADYLAVATMLRDRMPEASDLAVRALGSPLVALPSALGVPKPRPYDFDLRAIAVGGVVETGLPASLFGELWLIGGAAGLGVGGVALGFLLRRAFASLGEALGRKAVCMYLALGLLYLFLSRPLATSVSKLLIFTVAVLLAGLMVERKVRHEGRPPVRTAGGNTRTI